MIFHSRKHHITGLVHSNQINTIEIDQNIHSNDTNNIINHSSSNYKNNNIEPTNNSSTPSYIKINGRKQTYIVVDFEEEKKASKSMKEESKSFFAFSSHFLNLNGKYRIAN